VTDVAERVELEPEHLPQPLTDDEQAVVRDTAAPLLRDLAASGLVLPDIRYEAHEDRGSEAVSAWIQGPGGTGAGIWIRLGSPADQVTELAEQFQNWAADQLHDAGVAPEWPICPEHPVPPHRLNPEVRDGVAVWACWEGGHVTCEIGALAIPGCTAVRLRGAAPRAGNFGPGPTLICIMIETRCARAGVRLITVHDTRHSCATLLAALDVHPRVAMRFLRHAQIDVTMNVYTEVSDAKTLQALKRLGRQLGS
jgi:hypothetical protein